MRIGLVGGVFGTGRGRSTHEHTPETTLADGLEARGHDVSRIGHDRFDPHEQFDIVHVHHVGRAAYLCASQTARSWPFVFTGHSGHMLCGMEGSRAKRRAFHEVLLSSDALVALSRAEFGFLQSAVGVNKDVAVIPNGIPALYAQAPLDRDRAGIIFAGQLIASKGVATLIRAYAQSGLAERAVSLDLAYHQPGLESSLTALAESLGVAASVRFRGPLSAADLRDAMAASRILALPSLAESRPSVIAEAHLSGTPVVASAIGGIPEMVGPYGQLVTPAADVDAWAQALAAAYDSDWTTARRDAMRQRSLALHDVDKMVDAHVRLYEHTLARRPQQATSSKDRIRRSILGVGATLRYRR